MFVLKGLLVLRRCITIQASPRLVTPISIAISTQRRSFPRINNVRSLIRNFTTTNYAGAASNNESATVSFELLGKNGNSTRIHIQPSYPHKPKAVENLLKHLPALLTAASMPISAIKSFNTDGWDLDESGDTIHRYISLHDDRDIDQIFANIKAASKELNHDPHVHVDGNRLTISCTTHVPPGLSMKDVKLAKRIDEILKDITPCQSSDDDEAEILTLRQRGREQNMEAIRKAKLECGCG